MTAPTASPSTSGARRTIGWALGVGYAIFLGLVVFWPSPIDRPVSRLIDRVIQELHERGVPGFIDYEFVEFAANVALFLPVGLVLGLLIPMRAWMVTLLLGPTLSGLIEFAQKTLLAERYASVYDVVANSIGATVGVALAFGLRASVAARDKRVITRHEHAHAARARSTR